MVWDQLTNGLGNTCAPLSWNSSKINRVANNILEAETLACSSGMDEAIAIKDTIEEIFKLPRNTIPVDVVIDSNSLEEALRSTAAVDSKRLRRDMARIKENMAKRYVNSVTWVPGNRMLADMMTKQGVNTAALQVVMMSGSLNEKP